MRFRLFFSLEPVLDFVRKTRLCVVFGEDESWLRCRREAGCEVEREERGIGIKFFPLPSPSFIPPPFSFNAGKPTNLAIERVLPKRKSLTRALFTMFSRCCFVFFRFLVFLKSSWSFLFSLSVEVFHYFSGKVCSAW